MQRIDGRNDNELRHVCITKDYIKTALGSVLIESGNTRVICTATIEDKVPPFLKGTGKGWITAEYSMLPASTITRKTRESSKNKVEGRTMEIQRMIGRALRSVVDLNLIGERTIWIDCDVIQADGGTRTASITGSFIALVYAVSSLMQRGIILHSPITCYVAAISVGIVNSIPCLDLCYIEDSTAQVDMNIVMTDKGEFVEIQGTGEETPFSTAELSEMLKLGEQGINHLINLQKQILASLNHIIGSIAYE